MAKISRRLRPVPTRPRLVHGVRGPLRLFPASGASSLSLGRLPEPKSIGSRTPVPQNEKSPGAGASPRRSVYTVVPIRSGVGAARRQESASRGDVHAARHGCEQHGDRPGHGVRRRPLPAHVGWTPLRWRERRCVGVGPRAATDRADAAPHGAPQLPLPLTDPGPLRFLALRAPLLARAAARGGRAHRISFAPHSDAAGGSTCDRRPSSRCRRCSTATSAAAPSSQTGSTS